MTLRQKHGSPKALSDIAKHSPELAQLVVDAGTCSLLVKDIATVASHFPAKRISGGSNFVGNIWEYVGVREKFEFIVSLW